MKRGNCWQLAIGPYIVLSDGGGDGVCVCTRSLPFMLMQINQSAVPVLFTEYAVLKLAPQSRSELLQRTICSAFYTFIVCVYILIV